MRSQCLTVSLVWGKILSLKATTKSHKVIAHTTQWLAQKQTVRHEEERSALIDFSLKALLCGLCFDKGFCEVTPDFWYYGTKNLHWLSVI